MFLHSIYIINWTCYTRLHMVSLANPSYGKIVFIKKMLGRGFTLPREWQVTKYGLIIDFRTFIIRFEFSCYTLREVSILLR